MPNKQIMDVFIVHDPSLKKRTDNVKAIKDMMSKALFVDKVSVIEQFSVKDLTADNVKNLIRTKKPEVLDEVEKIFEKFQRPINLAHISNYLKHFKAIEQVLINKKPAIILEDDVIMADNCDEILNDPKIFEHDVVMFGQPFASTPTSKFTKMSNFSSNMVLLPSCDSYFISLSAASKILKNLVPIAYQTNIALSLNFNRAGISVSKVFPNAFTDGSKVGKYTSSLNNNNTLLFHSSYNKMYNMIQGGKFDESKFKSLFDDSEYQDSPDMLYLRGLGYLKADNIIEAKRVFDAAYKKYCEDGCTLNKTSSFMGNYLNFFRVMQTK